MVGIDKTNSLFNTHVYGTQIWLHNIKLSNYSIHFARLINATSIDLTRNSSTDGQLNSEEYVNRSVVDAHSVHKLMRHAIWKWLMRGQSLESRVTTALCHLIHYAQISLLTTGHMCKGKYMLSKLWDVIKWLGQLEGLYNMRIAAGCY